jgi:hypothetical protein
MNTDTIESWYCLHAWNTGPDLYGYGTADEAQRWADQLNEHRQINCYEVWDCEQQDREDGVTIADELTD